MPTLTTPSTVTFSLQIDQILTLTTNFGAGRIVLSAQKGGDVVFDYTNDQLQNTPVFSSGSQGLVTITHLSGSLTYNVNDSVLATLTTAQAEAVSNFTSGAVSGAVLASTAAGTLAWSAELTAGELVRGGGAGAVPSTAGAATVTGALAVTTGVITPKIYPAADSTTAVQINKADGSTAAVVVDTTNKRMIVGAGTSASSHTMIVAGSLQIGTAFGYVPGSVVDLAVGAPANNSRFLFGQSNSCYGGMLWTYNATAANAYFSITGNGTSKDITILQSGNVGIGTISPSDKLDVAGNIVLGPPDASPVARTVSGQGSRGGTDSNVGGANLTLRPGAGTGTGTASSLIITAPDLAASGTTQQTQTEVVRFNTSGAVFSKTVIQTPVASLTLGTNGQFGVEMTSNTAGNLVYRGSDGVTRRCALVFS